MSVLQRDNGWGKITLALLELMLLHIYFQNINDRTWCIFTIIIITFVQDFFFIPHDTYFQPSGYLYFSRINTGRKTRKPENWILEKQLLFSRCCCGRGEQTASKAKVHLIISAHATRRPKFYREGEKDRYRYAVEAVAAASAAVVSATWFIRQSAHAYSRVITTR